MPLQAMLELQAKGKFKFSDSDPVFIENISFIMGFCINFCFKKIALKGHQSWLLSFLVPLNMLCPHALQGGFSPLPIILSSEQGREGGGAPSQHCSCAPARVEKEGGDGTGRTAGRGGVPRRGAQAGLWPGAF